NALSYAHHFDEAAAALDCPLPPEAGDDPPLHGCLDRTRGFLLARKGRWDEGIAVLHRALARFGRDHFMTGDVLRTLGRAYAGQGNFNAAREFLEQSLRCKRACKDEAGESLTLRELGQRHFSWRYLDRAEQYFRDALHIARRRQDDAEVANLF